MAYSIDTSAILDGWRRYYPPDVFPQLWKEMRGLIHTGRLLAIEEVLHEIKKKDDEVAEWVAQHQRMVVAIDDQIQIAVARILSQFDRLVNTQRNRSLADPWVIALAQTRSLTVVTGERETGKLSRPMIPDVCRALGIRCINLLQLFREEGWVFR